MTRTISLYQAACKTKVINIFMASGLTIRYRLLSSGKSKKEEQRMDSLAAMLRGAFLPASSSFNLA